MMSINIYLFLVSFLGILIFLYLMWRRLKEDYTQTIIFNTSFMILIGLLVSNLISFYVYRAGWFWFSFLGVSLGLALSVYKYKLNVYEMIETVFISFVPFLTLVYLTFALFLRSWQLLVFVLINVLVIVLFYFLDSRYKRFSWYKSGRAGFAGILTAGIYFLVRGMIAILFPFMLSFVGKYDAILSGCVALIFFLVIFKLSKG